MSPPFPEGAAEGARTDGADEIRARREPGPGFLSRLPGMAYQCRNDPDWTMEFVSGGCLTLTGYGPEELVGPRGTTYGDVVHPDDRARVWGEVQRALDAGEASFTLRYRIVCASGKVKEVWEQGHPVRTEDGELLALEGFVTDITEMQDTKRRLASSEELVRSLARQGTVGVFVVRDGLFRHVNPAFARIFGRAEEEIRDRLGPTDLCAPAERERVASVLEAALGGEQATARVEFWGVRRDGAAVRVEAHGTRIDLADGPGVAGVLLDVTDRHSLEERLRHAQRVEGLGELTGAIAHDFNNYLTAILAPLEMVLQDIDEKDAARTELLMVRDTAQRAASLTRQLLSFGRKRVFSPRPLDLTEVLEGCRAMLDRLTGERVELVYDVEPNLPPVDADPSHIQQVVVNLVLNARDAMEGAGRILVRLGRATERDLKARRMGKAKGRGWVVLSVRDDGHGMDAATMARIFDPYFTTKAAGTGLGLSTVHGIVKQHGGEIGVDSAPGAGTEFTILLPEVQRVARPLDEPAKAVPDPVDRERAGRTILVVEDEEAVRRVTVAALRRYGYDVLSAQDGAHALAAEDAHPTPVHLLLTDMMLPDTTGTELAATLRSRRPGMPVVVMSGYAPEEILRDPARGEDFRFLEKPFVIGELLGTVRDVLESSDRRELKAAT